MEAVRAWTDVKKQIVLAEMAHRWRVDAVTQRYQQHMEKVRRSPVHLHYGKRGPRRAPWCSACACIRLVCKFGL